MVSQIRLIALAVVLLLAATGAWRIHRAGFDAGVAACELADKKQSEAAERRAREDAAARQRSAVAAGQAQAAARLDQLRRRDALERDLVRRPAPADCGLDAESVRVLNDAIRAGNDGSAPAASGVPGGLPAGAGTD